MNEQAILDNILALLEAHSVKVRRERLEESSGGLCKVKGERVLFLDISATVSDQAALCAAALANVVDINTVYLLPEVRRFIEDWVNHGPDA